MDKTAPKTYYYIPNIWEKDVLDIEDATAFPSNLDIVAVDGGYDEFETQWLVEEMAKDYYCNCDGWEIGNSWSGSGREFALWDADKNFVGRFDVILEYEPTFSAWRKK